MRIYLNRKHPSGVYHYADWNRSLTINFYAHYPTKGVINYHAMTLGGFTSDDPPTQLDALQAVIRYTLPDGEDI